VQWARRGFIKRARGGLHAALLRLRDARFAAPEPHGLKTIVLISAVRNK